MVGRIHTSAPPENRPDAPISSTQKQRFTVRR